MCSDSPVHLRADDLSEDDLLDHYPWPPGRTWVRAMMVTTLDGAAAGADGVSRSLSSPPDQRVFNAVRRHADAVLIGAQTLRAEHYAPMRARPADAEARARAGQRPAPVVAVVSRSLELPWELPLWTVSTHTPLVLTGPTAPAEAIALARSCADLIVLDELTPEAIIATLTARGLRRIVCEGGPHLLRDLSAAGLIDEADITVAPLMAGTATSPTTGMLALPRRFELAHLIEDDSYLMARYIAAER